MQLHEVGTPDLIGYAIDGKLIGIEVKDEANFYRNDKGLRKQQIERLDDMSKHGCYVGVACAPEHVDLIMEKCK
jgi:hypothetical protein